MKEPEIKVRLFRFDPNTGADPAYREYTVPLVPGMSAMNALDYIYQHLDPAVAYFDHAGCALGICARCTGKINGKAGLLCQTEITGDVTLEPINKDRVVRDLVVSK
jgi:succinate dehydrogenase/fumarate reductase-like Fe-S protein